MSRRSSNQRKKVCDEMGVPLTPWNTPGGSFVDWFSPFNRAQRRHLIYMVRTNRAEVPDVIKNVAAFVRVAAEKETVGRNTIGVPHRGQF